MIASELNVDQELSVPFNHEVSANWITKLQSIQCQRIHYSRLHMFHKSWLRTFDNCWIRPFFYIWWWIFILQYLIAYNSYNFDYELSKAVDYETFFNNWLRKVYDNWLRTSVNSLKTLQAFCGSWLRTLIDNNRTYSAVIMNICNSCYRTLYCNRWLQTYSTVIANFYYGWLWTLF